MHSSSRYEGFLTLSWDRKSSNAKCPTGWQTRQHLHLGWCEIERVHGMLVDGKIYYWKLMAPVWPQMTFAKGRWFSSHDAQEHNQLSLAHKSARNYLLHTVPLLQKGNVRVRSTLKVTTTRSLHRPPGKPLSGTYSADRPPEGRGFDTPCHRNCGRRVLGCIEASFRVNTCFADKKSRRQNEKREQRKETNSFSRRTRFAQMCTAPNS